MPSSRPRPAAGLSRAGAAHPVGRCGGSCAARRNHAPDSGKSGSSPGSGSPAMQAHLAIETALARSIGRRGCRGSETVHAWSSSVSLRTGCPIIRAGKAAVRPWGSSSTIPFRSRQFLWLHGTWLHYSRVSARFAKERFGHVADKATPAAAYGSWAFSKGRAEFGQSGHCDTLLRPQLAFWSSDSHGLEALAKFAAKWPSLACRETSKNKPRIYGAEPPKQHDKGDR